MNEIKERFNENYFVPKLMKYYTAKKEEDLNAALEDDSNYALSLKVDGASYIWAKDLDGSVHLYKDSISKKTKDIIDKIDNCPHLKSFAEEFFPNGTQIIVEIFSHYDWMSEKKVNISKSQYVNSLMLCTGEKATARQQVVGYCGAYIFDILFYNKEPFYKEDMRERHYLLMQLQKKWEKVFYNKYQTALPEWMVFAKRYLTNKKTILTNWLKEGREGGVLSLWTSTNKLSAAHHITTIGSTAKRPAHISYKVKQMDTVDLLITSVEMPTKEYTGKDGDSHKYKDENGNPVNRLWYLGYANSIGIGAFDENGEMITIGTIASGLDDELRKNLAEKPEDYIGKVIEVMCMSIDKSAKTLRHPRFYRFREDKEATDITMKEIFE